MADQQLKDNKIRVFKVRARQYLRKHYKPSKVEYFAICKYCSSEISYNKSCPSLLVHLTIYHTELLTEEQKTIRNIQWAWDYFTLTSSGDAQCNVCEKIYKSHDAHRLEIHLNAHRKT